VQDVNLDVGFQENDVENMKAHISVRFIIELGWPYQVLDDYNPLEENELTKNGNFTILNGKCDVPTDGDCSTPGCTHIVELTFDSSIMCSKDTVDYAMKLRVINLEKEVKVLGYDMKVVQKTQCAVVTESGTIEGAVSLRNSDFSADATQKLYRVKETAYLQIDLQGVRPIETIEVLELAVTLDSSEDGSNPKRHILHSSDTDKIDLDMARKLSISDSLRNEEHLVQHKFYFHEDYFTNDAQTSVKFEYACKLAYFAEGEKPKNPENEGRRALKHVTVRDTFALGSRDTEFDPLWPQPRRALQLNDAPQAPPLNVDVLVLPFKCSGDFGDASIDSAVKVECGEKFMYIECTANGWEFENISGDCKVLQAFTFDVEVRGDDVPTCENIVDTMTTLLAKPLQNSRCSRKVDPKQEGSDLWKIANYEVTHTNHDITQDDINSVLGEDSSSFKLELGNQTGIQVGNVNGLEQHVEFDEVTVVEFSTPTPLTSQIPLTSQSSTSALPATSTTTPVVVEAVEPSSGDDYTIHLIIGCIALVCICVGQYFWFRLSKSVQKIQEVYTGETKEDEEVGSPKMIDLASDEGELQLKAAVSDEAVAIDPSMFLGELYDYYLTTNKTTAGKEGEGTTTTENNDWKFLLFE